MNSKLELKIKTKLKGCHLWWIIKFKINLIQFTKLINNFNHRQMVAIPCIIHINVYFINLPILYLFNYSFMRINYGIMEIFCFTMCQSFNINGIFSWKILTVHFNFLRGKFLWYERKAMKKCIFCLYDLLLIAPHWIHILI